jgi:hypothetical protein
MSRTLIVIVGLVVLFSGVSNSSAFTTYPVDRVVTFDRQADSDQFSDKTSNDQSGGTSFGLPGGLPGRFKFEFSGPSSSNTAPNSPFVTFPSTVFVPSEHR